MRTRLVERARDGDDVAFTELVDLDGDRCYAIAYRILRDAERAEDAVAQASDMARPGARRKGERRNPLERTGIANAV